MIWPAWLLPLGRLLKLASVESCNLRKFLSNCSILIKLSAFFKYLMILFILCASATVEFLNLVLVSHVWNEMSSLMIPETQLSWRTAFSKSFLSFSSNWSLDWCVSSLLKRYFTDAVDVILLTHGDCKVSRLSWFNAKVNASASSVPNLNVCFNLDIISYSNLLLPP